jgi:hypothetical protein
MRNRKRKYWDVRDIVESLDSDGFPIINEAVKPNHPIDQLIQFTQQNGIKWNWNDNKFIRAMRDVYHNAGVSVPNSREDLIKDLQQQSEQEPKLLDQMISSLGGMSRRHFMGLSAGAGAGVATGMIDFKGPEKGRLDKTLKPGQHYKVTYRSFQNRTRVWKDLVFHSTDSHMYWFMDPNKPIATPPRRYRAPSPYQPMTTSDRQEMVQHWQRDMREKQEILAGKRPYRTAQPAFKGWSGRTIPAKPAKYVRSNWPLTAQRLKSQIAWRQNEIKRLQDQGAPANKRREHQVITLQIENVVDVTPLGSK